MPVYLCQPGVGATEPWRHGIQVYAAPFDLVDVVEDPSMNETTMKNDTSGGSHHNSTVTANDVAANAGDTDNLIVRRRTEEYYRRAMIDTSGQGTVGTAAAAATAADSPSASQIINVTAAGGNVQLSRDAQSGIEIRRIRHAEVVLVDDVCVAHGRHWLRLRWPGHKGGFAGYIALGKVSEPLSKQIVDALQENTFSDDEANRIVDSAPIMVETSGMISGGQSLVLGSSEEELREGTDEGTGGDEPQDNASTLSSEPFESDSSLTCIRTGLVFPSSIAMKLLASYDDGLSPRVISAPVPSEPVFCRICREGLHDDADDEQPSPTIENDADEGGTSSRGLSNSPTGSIDAGNETNDDPDDDLAEGREPMESEPTIVLTKGPIQPNPAYHPNTHASENPMLSPCECSGSMAFVHYMCVEQWRCRSRHPDACRGLNCETCGKPYALPPPSARPANDLRMDNDDWLDAMPPHVMNALRNPHIWWQIGAAIVRRRYLRPIAPVIMSPIVALYCRARRLLKKKGVARRRWACSLCRRRARWKCVRCLRSYYCSRQCQNVSWHIVHKHVCYKPSRYFWSVVVYFIGTTMLFPGMLRDPIFYDAGLGFVPISFYVMAILGGGIATLLKKSAGMDLRGRSFELLVVAGSLELVRVMWGLLGAMVGTPNSCLGVARGLNLEKSAGANKFILRQINRFILKPSMNWFRFWDRSASNTWPWFRRIVCMPDQNEGCFEYSYKADVDYLFADETDGRCASDMLVLFYVLFFTIALAVGNTMWKRRDRQRRGPRRMRLHQD